MSKYLTFKQPSMLPTHTTAALPNSSAQNPQNTAEDLISWCVEDIVSKVKEKPLSQEEKKLVYSPQFKEELYKFMIAEPLKFALEAEKDNLDPLFVEVIENSEDLEEIFSKVYLYSLTNNFFSLSLSKGIYASYIQKCFELEILLNPVITALFFN